MLTGAITIIINLMAWQNGYCALCLTVKLTVATGSITPSMDTGPFAPGGNYVALCPRLD